MNTNWGTYLIEAMNGTVKIGSSCDPMERLKIIRTHSPVPVRLIAIFGYRECELHKRFASARSHNEWFVLEGDFKVFVETYRGAGLQQVEPWEEIVYHVGPAFKQISSDRKSKALKAAWARRKQGLPSLNRSNLMPSPTPTEAV